ncbi:MAG: endopeptidase La [Chloroflexi bacterium 54-19]|nr:MAG: endopeptidase La [Chloroflexi bacterium 54-19]
MAEDEKQKPKARKHSKPAEDNSTPEPAPVKTKKRKPAQELAPETENDASNEENASQESVIDLPEMLKQLLEEHDEPEPVEDRKPSSRRSRKQAASKTASENSINDLSQMPDIPSILPILPLKDTVVYPLTVFPLAVGQERSIRLIEEVMQGDAPRLVGLVAQKNMEVEQAGVADTFTVGTVAAVHKLLKVPDGTIRLAVQGLEKMRIVEFVETEPYLKARIEVLQDTDEKSVEVEALMRNSISLFQRLVSLVPQIPDELLMTAINVESPRQLAYLIATSVRMELEQRQEILETSSIKNKLEMLNAFLTKELEVLELGRKIQSQVQDELGKTQREYFLREQIKAIQKELGEDDPQSAEINQFRELIQKSKMPVEARREAERELDRLSKLPPAAAEYGVIKTYLDWLTSLPWDKSTEAPLDILLAKKVLDEDHYDLEKIKERLLEYLAVRKLRNERLPQPKPATEPDGTSDGEASLASEALEPTPGNLNDGPLTYEDVHNFSGPREPILCLVGPPGVGKTSLGQSIARALGRKFTRMSLGGMRDEAEIRGHRRTYIGALPGRIIQAIRRAESNDPVFMLDEVDKIGADYRGDPSSALLEVLDPEQNRDFRDHYLDVPFDLSKVMFIATANLLDPIPAPLRDRMEILQLAGYTEEEKVHIAFQHLVPKQLRAHALTTDDAEITNGAMRRIIRDYTREAGVRNLEREIATVLRKIARGVAEGKTGKVIVEADALNDYLGKQRYFSDAAERTQQPGVATGLAWTEVGGDILFIEATRMPGNKQLIITGQLGEVMKESAQAALSLVRSKAKELGISQDFYDKSDLHIHIPAGAIPKDGPSAGITLTTALASLLTGRLVHGDVAMTGEITLRGKVLPIGGLKEKVLAAHRAGVKRIILPRLNARDLDDLPDELRKELEFFLVDNIDEVLNIALEKPGEAHIETDLSVSTNGHRNGAKVKGSRKSAKKDS